MKLIGKLDCILLVFSERGIFYQTGKRLKKGAQGDRTKTEKDWDSVFWGYRGDDQQGE